jgi:serine/threonine-protein kinase
VQPTSSSTGAVALKLLAPKADVVRFEREAHAFAALARPNVTQLYDYGEDGGRPYMVLEYVPGGTLEDRLRKGALPDAETHAVATDIASGLAHAHSRGVIHRDLKPTNVLFDEERRAKLADFGIAQTADAGTITEDGTVLGTAAYISPEQANGAAATPASDVYSFGVILFRMLTGRLPFQADDPLALVAAHRDVAAPLVESVRPDAPLAFAALTAAALAKDPRQRPQDGSALLAALDGSGMPATPATDVTRAMPPLPRIAAARRSSSRSCSCSDSRAPRSRTRSRVPMEPRRPRLRRREQASRSRGARPRRMPRRPRAQRARARPRARRDRRRREQPRPSLRRPCAPRPCTQPPRRHRPPQLHRPRQPRRRPRQRRRRPQQRRRHQPRPRRQ